MSEIDHKEVAVFSFLVLLLAGQALFLLGAGLIAAAIIQNH